jgi:hypothetical protein
MINVWGICEFGGIFTTQMVQWDLWCEYFNPKESEKGEITDKHCVNCVYWITSDDLLMEREK